jgi:hypothetical protein
MKILPDVHHIDWLHDLGAAVTIVALPALMLFVLGIGGIMLGIPVMIVMSFLAGYWLIPRDLWLAFIVAFLLTWASFGIADRLGALGDGEDYYIPHWFVGVMILVPMIAVALVPLWTGRVFKRDNLRLEARRKAAAGPD